MMLLFQAQAQTPVPPPTADPYANNPDAGKLQFPLAAPAGKDPAQSPKRCPAASIREWSIRPRGNTDRHSIRRPNSKIWNPVKLKMMRGEKVTGGTVFSSDRSRNLLRHGECRLRLHLDRDAARFARLGSGGPHVARLPARQSRSRRARGLRR